MSLDVTAVANRELGSCGSSETSDKAWNTTWRSRSYGLLRWSATCSRFLGLILIYFKVFTFSSLHALHELLPFQGSVHKRKATLTYSQFKTCFFLPVHPKKMCTRQSRDILTLETPSRFCSPRCWQTFFTIDGKYLHNIVWEPLEAHEETKVEWYRARLGQRSAHSLCSERGSIMRSSIISGGKYRICVNRLFLIRTRFHFECWRCLH